MLRPKSRNGFNAAGTGVRVSGKLTADFSGANAKTTMK